MPELRVMTIPDCINLRAAFWGCQVTESTDEIAAWIDELQSPGFHSALEAAGFPG
jgi:hypothetical protein